MVSCIGSCHGIGGGPHVFVVAMASCIGGGPPCIGGILYLWWPHVLVVAMVFVVAIYGHVLVVTMVSCIGGCHGICGCHIWLVTMVYCIGGCHGIFLVSVMSLRALYEATTVGKWQVAMLLF